MAYGRIEQHRLESVALRGNRFDDPHIRPVTLYLPPGYDDTNEPYPVVYMLPAHGKTGQAFLNWKPWESTFPEQLDGWIEAGTVAPCIVVLPDVWTRLGSSQYLNSAIGNYEDYLIQELVPFVDSKVRGNGRRGLIGHSSGGYGAIVQAMRHPELFHAVACHAADMYWEYTCLPGIAGLHQALAKVGGAAEFLAQVESITPKGGTFWKTVMVMCWAMVHATNPDAELGFDLPIDPTTGALDESVWQRWLAFDPVRMIDDANYQAALRAMRLVYIAAGEYDEYQAQIGARLFSQKLHAAGITHIHEEQPIGHSGSDVPYEHSLGLLVQALI